MDTRNETGLLATTRAFLRRLFRPADLTPEQAEAIGRGFSLPIARR